jgi:hypothetical protein
MKIIYTCILFLVISTNSSSQSALFDNSYGLLNDMLTGKQNVSFKKAVLSTENAYLDGKLDTTKVNKELNNLKHISLELVQNRFLYYPEKDKETVNKWASIFQVICDTIRIESAGRMYKYLPFRYDFNDVFGHTNSESLFVSKLLLTKSGNCHSLPYLYKILAEDLGVEANLALAPNHIYIKHKSIKDGWYNTELTSGIFPIDAWLMASGYIHIDAITNGVYMKALNNKESIAVVMLDLAEYYEKRYPNNDGEFVLKCCDAALSVYPNFAKALILKAETHKKQNIDTKELVKEYSHIHQLGYRNMPENMYLNWLVSLKEEREKYEDKKLQGK